MACCTHKVHVYVIQEYFSSLATAISLVQAKRKVMANKRDSNFQRNLIEDSLQSMIAP